MLKDFIDKNYEMMGYTDKVKIDANKCVGCSKCVGLCPMKNLKIEQSLAKAGDNRKISGEITYENDIWK